MQNAPTCTITLPSAYGGADETVTVHDEAVVQFASRLRKMAKERRKWAKRENIACYRVYDADLPEYAAAVDIYLRMDGVSAEDGGPDGAPDAAPGGLPSVASLSAEDMRARTYVHVAEYQAPKKVDPAKASARFEDLLAVIPPTLGIPESHVFAKVRKRDKGGSQYAQNREPFTFTTSEAGLALEVDLNGYLDTGLFLDHRTTRMNVGKLARGRRFLNLFSYTGSATVHAAAGGALATVTVDLSQTYLNWAKRNMAANGFSGPNHVYQRADTMAWLQKAAEAGIQFDLAFVDPPTFSNSKAMGKATWDVQRDHVELLRRVYALLAPGGVAIFSCNLRSFKPDDAALAKHGITLKNVSAGTIPPDFERNPKIHYCFTMAKPR